MTAPAGRCEIDRALADWKPGTVRVAGRLSRGPAADLASLLGMPAPELGEQLRPMWHEVQLREPVDAASLGPDGHPERSALVPPITDRRRLFAGTTVRMHSPPTLGSDVERVATVAGTRVVTGRRGVLLLVRERHEWTQDGLLRITEHRTLAYRSGTSTEPDADVPIRPADGSRGDTLLTWQPTPAALDAYSRLTANAHRIHTDAAYARDVEGHAGLLVHGPLLALLAAEAVKRYTGVAPTCLEVRLVAPAIAGDELAFECSTDPAAQTSEVVGRSSGRVVLSGTAT